MGSRVYKNLEAFPLLKILLLNNAPKFRVMAEQVLKDKSSFYKGGPLFFGGLYLLFLKLLSSFNFSYSKISFSSLFFIKFSNFY